MYLVAVARLISAFKLATWNHGPKSTVIPQFDLYLAINADVMFVFFDGILPQLEAKTYVTLYVLRCLVIQARVWRCVVPSNYFVKHFGEIVLFFENLNLF